MEREDRGGEGMTGNKRMDLLKRAIPTIILFSAYIFIFETTWNDKYQFNIGFVYILIGIAATMICYFVCSKLLKIDYGRVGDFVPQVVIFLIVNYFAMLYYEITLKVEEWFSVPLLTGTAFLFMYAIGSSIYFLGVSIVQSIKQKKLWEALKRAASVMVGYILYLGLILAGQWADKKWDFIYNVPWIFQTIIKYAVLFAATAIFHFINKKILKISSEKFRNHAVLLWSFVCISFVLCFFHMLKEDEVFDFSLAFTSIVFTYVKANLTYYLVKSLWNAFFRRKEKVKADKNLKEDEILTEEEITDSRISSEIILIPGIDDDLGEVGSENTNEGNA